MKIIDKKNRLFGRIHFVFILIPIILIFLGLVVYQLKMSKPHYVIVRIKGSPGNWWWVTPRPPDWLVYSVKVGDKEYNALGKPTAEILNVAVYDAGGPNRDIYVKAKLEVKYNKQTKKYRYKGEPLEIGGPIALNLSRTLFPGMVVEIMEENETSKREFVDKIATVRYLDRWPWEFEAIKIGEAMTDGAGDVIAEILGKERRPAEKEAYTYSGEIHKAFSPVKDDFFIRLKLKAEKKGDEFVFREEQYIKIGNYIWALFPSYNFAGAQIISFEK